MTRMQAQHDNQSHEPGEQKQSRQEAMRGLAKGLAIIEAFTSLRPQLTVTTAAQASGATPAAARRCLLTLETLGFVTSDGKYFSPTPRMARLGGAYQDVSPLPALAQPCLNAVRDELGEACSLAVLDGDSVVFIARAEADRLVWAGIRVGARLPVHATSTGRVLLAALSDEELETRLSNCRPERTSPKTLVRIPDIRQRVQRARDTGAAFTDEEIEVGMRSVAVPVIDAAGRVQAAMSVSLFAARASLEEMRERFVPVLEREAHRLGAML
jgi:IclR family pca regulon transcriptional regulator